MSIGHQIISCTSKRNPTGHHVTFRHKEIFLSIDRLPACYCYSIFIVIIFFSIYCFPTTFTLYNQLTVRSKRIRCPVNHLFSGHHHTIRIQIISCLTKRNPAAHHIAFRHKEISLSIDCLPACLHYSVFIQIISCTSKRNPAGHHITFRHEEVFLSIDCLPACLHHSIIIKIISFSINCLPTSYHLSI